MLRDLKSNLVQFVSIFVMTFMGIFIFTGMNAVGEGMDQSVSDFYKETKLADALIYGSDFTMEEVQNLRKQEGIHNVERRLQLNASLADNTKSMIQLNIVESNQICLNHIVEGQAFEPDKDGIWLNSSYAKENLIHVGDTLSIKIQGQLISKTVQGLIMHPEYVYALKDENEVIPDHKTFGYAFLSAHFFSGDWGFDLSYNQLLLKSNRDKKSIETIKNTVFPNKQTILVMQEDHTSVRMFQNEVSQMKAMQTVFPIAFLLIAILTTLTTMTRLTSNQRTQIGILKSVGFLNRKIIWHYMSYGVFIGTVSSMLGLFTGPIFLPKLMFKFQKGFYTLPEWNGSLDPRITIIVLGGILLCGISGFYACYKELQGVAAQILRPKPPKAGKHTKLEKSRWWNNLKFDIQWNIRDLLRNRLRSVITVVGIIGCMTLILCAFGLRDTMDDITNEAYDQINTYDTKIVLSDSTSSERMIELKKNQEYQFIQETSVEINIRDEIVSSVLTVVGDGVYINHRDKFGYKVELPKKGLAITNKIAELHDLKVGNMVTWRLYGTGSWVTGEIKVIIRNPIMQGIFISEEAYQAMDLVLRPTAFLTDEAVSEFSNNDFASVQSKEDIVKNMETMMETMNVMIAILVLAAVILGVVVLYNLGILSFQERIRELTTLKVLGFQYHKLRQLLQMQNIWLTLIGIIIGVPGGYLLLTYMLKFMGDSFDLLPHITVFSYGVSIIGTLLLSVVVNWFLSRKLRTIDMVSALKSVE
ncbi:ABC transporter permease [Mobilitalea sibirica]|nr:ABC transporter permease [Mobilitalea sibirica]